MTIYAVYDKDAITTPAVVPDRFSWFAALLPPVFAIAHGLWLELAAFILLLLLLGVVSSFAGAAAALLIYLAFAVWIGFEVPALRRASLRRHGWRFRRELVAAADDLAELQGLEDRNA